jgi:hypothetical protein
MMFKDDSPFEIGISLFQDGQSVDQVIFIAQMVNPIGHLNTSLSKYLAAMTF